MLVTLFGMVTEVRPEQPKNALFPMLVTLFGMVREIVAERQGDVYSAVFGVL